MSSNSIKKRAVIWLYKHRNVGWLVYSKCLPNEIPDHHPENWEQIGYILNNKLILD